MELRQYLAVIAEETGTLATLVENDPGRAVPACPGWTLADMVRHLGTTQRWAAAIVAADGIERVPYPEPDAEIDDAALSTWLRTGAVRLIETLDAAGPDKPVWTMGEPRSSRFWFRRLAQEVLLHRWDGEEAVGDPTPLPPDLAADGLAEYLEVFLARLHRRGGTPGAGETFHVHRTDGPGEWLIRFGPEGAEVTTEHAKGDLALRGSASDLLLALQHRRPYTSVEVFGDPALLERWAALVPTF